MQLLIQILCELWVWEHKGQTWDEFLLLAIEIFGHLHKKKDDFLYDCGNNWCEPARLCSKIRGEGGGWQNKRKKKVETKRQCPNLITKFQISMIMNSTRGHTLPIYSICNIWNSKRICKWWKLGGKPLMLFNLEL